MFDLKSISERLKERGYNFKDWADNLYKGLTISREDGIDGHICEDEYFFVRKNKRLVFSPGQTANIDESIKNEFKYIIYGQPIVQLK
mgnify:CR=1 FL=1